MPTGCTSEFAHFPPCSPRRERRLTSRRKWLRGLPRAPIDPTFLDNANDNRPPLRAKRALSLKGMLDWTYRLQKAHLILREKKDWFLWAMDAAGYIELPSDRRQLHHDAAVVHEAVLGLGNDLAAFVIEMAVTGMWPEPLDALEPVAYPMEPPDKFEEFGRHVFGDGRRIVYWIRTAEVVSIPREEYELVGRRKMQRAKAAGYDRVPVRYCPIRWDPELEYIEAHKRRIAKWSMAAKRLPVALTNAQFLDHILIANENDSDDPPDAANDNL